MTTTTRAERLGTALGRGAAFFWYDQNVVLRRIKRCALIVALLALLVVSFRPLMDIVVTLSVFALILGAIAANGGGNIGSSSDDDGIYGRDECGYEVDMKGDRYDL